ncbi:uncharacterized protein LOC111710649 [Eurytemora carolleeae]|uniref:uncharacterized protein LOC111710649 n=1 Tax=Eurytemora carolleeae TaxID=1294199 RepID=UPI000C75AAF0|nr:uncharacterized protein LOC111710649 [Eurytemora carolleeae]|eukprot:XP_023340532.1 uncharacterized protein LOC111710649 [Eurytemora affinis]
MARGTIVYAMGSKELFDSLPEIPKTQSFSQGTYFLFTIIYQVTLYVAKWFKFKKVYTVEADPQRRTMNSAYNAFSAFASIIAMVAGTMVWVNHFYVLHTSAEYENTNSTCTLLDNIVNLTKQEEQENWENTTCPTEAHYRTELLNRILFL